MTFSDAGFLGSFRIKSLMKYTIKTLIHSNSRLEVYVDKYFSYFSTKNTLWYLVEVP